MSVFNCPFTDEEYREYKAKHYKHYDDHKIHKLYKTVIFKRDCIINDFFLADEFNRIAKILKDAEIPYDNSDNLTFSKSDMAYRYLLPKTKKWWKIWKQ
jgi:hypothetical protein